MKNGVVVKFITNTNLFIIFLSKDKNIINLKKIYPFLDTKHVAQWIEHQIPILRVKGSIPFMLIVFY
jgi:hypothetical protein